ncbi:MAG TPA: presqualene diphosphate synthase HpnD [bacterium]|nr:presqualene diphosphate synthase HpnD [bacterium]HQO34444.1 presqualene diphosphate synthase HpnD [bacterium]HQP98021.1 presqualene diphosphate synthase HpnD [bacterium]
MANNTYSATHTRKSKSNFYYALRFLPRLKREAIYSVYAFCRFVDDAVDEADDEADAERKIAGWRSEIGNLFDGNPSHPVTRDLQSTLKQFPIPREYFEELIAGVEMDVRYARYPTFDDLLPYCHRVASVVGLISIEIFGYRDARAKDFARDLGIALQLTNILRDVGKDAEQNRIYLPLEDLKQFGVTEEEILQKRSSPQMRLLLEKQYHRALDFYRRASECAKEMADPQMFPAQIMGAIYRRILARIAEQDFSVFGERITIPTWEKLSIAFQAWIASRYFPSALWRNAY